MSDTGEVDTVQAVSSASCPRFPQATRRTHAFSPLLGVFSAISRKTLPIEAVRHDRRGTSRSLVPDIGPFTTFRAMVASQGGVGSAALLARTRPQRWRSAAVGIAALALCWCPTPRNLRSDPLSLAAGEKPLSLFGSHMTKHAITSAALTTNPAAHRLRTSPCERSQR